MRKSYSPEFKAKVVCAILREDNTLSQIARKVGLHWTWVQKIIKSAD